jgi:hypothetical protein
VIAKRVGGVGGILLVFGSLVNVATTMGWDLVTEIGQKVECHLVQMLENQLQAGVVDEAGGELGGDGNAAIGDEPHTPETTSREASSSKESQSCGSSEWQVLSQWCQVVTRSDVCTPTGLASAICEKATLCTAAVDAVKNTSDTVKAAVLAPFQRAWAAIRGRPVPFSPDSVTGGTDEADAAADLNADVPYGTEPDLSDPIEDEVLETAADEGGGDAAQAAGDTTHGLEEGLSTADETFGAATDTDVEGLNGDDGPGAAAGDVDKAAADAVEAGAETAGSIGLKVVADVGLKVLGWAGLAWSTFGFIGELTANYTTSDQIQQSGWHYYGLLDIVPPSNELLISQDQLNRDPSLQSEFGTNLITCQNLIDLQAQVLGDPTSVANQEIVGSFLDPSASPIEVGAAVPETSSTHAWGHVDQDKQIHDPVTGIIPVGSKTFDANIGQLLGELVPNPETGRPDGDCGLGVPGATQPQTPNWAQVIQGALTQDEQLAGVISAEQAGSPAQLDPWGVPDGAAFTDWTVNDILTFGLGADPLVHYYDGDDLLGQDESLASGRCISAMALTPYEGMVPDAYSELLSQVKQGNFTAFDLLDQAATQLSSDDNPTTGDCLDTPLGPSIGGCITGGTDVVNQAAQAGVSPYQSCAPTPLWRTSLPVYSPGYPDLTLSQALQGVLGACGCSPPPAASATPTAAIDLNQAAQAQGYASSWDSQETSETATDEMDDQTAAMALAICDVYGEGDPLLVTAQSASPTQAVGPGAGGNIGCYQQLPGEMGASLAQAPGAQGQAVDVSDPSVQAEGAVIELTDDLEASGGDVQGAFAMYIRDNHLAPYNGAWHGDGEYVPGQAATLAETQEGVGDWSEETGVGDGQHLPTVPSADLLTEAYSEYAMYLEPGNQLGTQAAPQGLDAVSTAGALVYPPEDQLSAFATAEQRTGVPQALLIALAAAQSGMTFNQELVSQTQNPDGSPTAFGEFQMEPAAFTAAGEELGLPPPALAAVADTQTGTAWGEPQGELDVSDEALAAGQILADQGVTSSSGTATLEAAVTAFQTPAAASTASPSATPTAGTDAQTVVVEYLPAYQAWVTAGEPAMGGSPPACASSKCDVGLYPTPGVFPWVPAGGFPHSYPLGQCTYWASANFDPFPAGVGGGTVQNLTNGGDWYATARSLGLPTLPPSVLPPYGSAVSYLGFPGDQGDGHVAVVISDDPDGRGYWVSEMNVDGLGMVDVAHYPFPNPDLQGSILAPQAGGG